MSAAYRSSLTITLADGTVLVGRAAREYVRSSRPAGPAQDDLQVHGGGLGFLADLAPGSVSALYLGRCDPTSFAAVRHLAPGLRRLYLADSAFDDAVLAHVAALTGLTYLQTFGNAFTDAGVQVLGALSGLEHLYLEEATLGAGAFAFTERLPNLQRLGLQDVDLTDSELAALRERLPGVHVG